MRDFCPYEDELSVILRRLSARGSMDLQTSAELCLRLLIEVNTLKKKVKILEDSQK